MFKALDLAGFQLMARLEVIICLCCRWRLKPMRENLPGLQYFKSEVEKLGGELLSPQPAYITDYLPFAAMSMSHFSKCSPPPVEAKVRVIYGLVSVLRVYQ